MLENSEAFVISELRRASTERCEPGFSGLEQFETLKRLGLVETWITIFRSMYTGVLDQHAYLDEHGMLIDIETHIIIAPAVFFTERLKGGGWEVDISTLKREKLRELLGTA